MLHLSFWPDINKQYLPNSYSGNIAERARQVRENGTRGDVKGEVEVDIETELINCISNLVILHIVRTSCVAQGLAYILCSALTWLLGYLGPV